MNHPVSSGVFADKVRDTAPLPFDWEAWNADFDGRMASLETARARWHEAERALDEANKSLVADLREHFEQFANGPTPAARERVG